jgi:tRNA modification GTPase
VFAGELGRKADAWREKLIRAAALLEATIDFADEEVPVDVGPEVTELVTSVLAELRIEMAGIGIAERVRSGFEVAIVGSPNVGKSTLLNALAGREAAITSDIAGTTRDVIEVRMDLGGLPVTLLDTAGLRETEDAVESIGVRLARQRAEAADLRVFLVNSDEVPPFEPLDEDMVVVGKADLVGEVVGRISGKTGYGIDQLVEGVRSRLASKVAGSGVATRERHRVAMARACEYLERGIKVLAGGPEVSELAAEEFRSAIRSLEALVGRVDVESLLDDIFSSFCIGK